MASDAETCTTADVADTQLEHDDGVAKEGSDKPTTKTLAKWDAARKGKLQEENPDVDMWLVDSRDEDIGPFAAVYVRGGASNPRFKALCERLGTVPDETVRNSRGSFLKGQPLSEEETVTIPVFYGKRCPPHAFMFRTTHGGSPDGLVPPMPYRGLKPRGYGVVRTNPLTMQASFQRHLNWRYRGKGPFLSVTTSLEVAQFFADMFRFRGCQHIKIHLIDMHAKEWDCGEPPVFYVADLVRAFAIHCRRTSYLTEYLVEGAIPEGSIIETAEGGEVPRHWEVLAKRPTTKADLTKLRGELRKRRVQVEKRKLRRQNNRQAAAVRQAKEMREDRDTHGGKEDKTQAEEHEQDMQGEVHYHEGGQQDAIEQKPTAGEEPEKRKEIQGKEEHEDQQLKQDGEEHEGRGMPEEGDKPQDHEADRPDQGDMLEATDQPTDEASGTTGTDEKTTPPEPKREVRKRCKGFHRVTPKQD